MTEQKEKKTITDVLYDNLPTIVFTVFMVITVLGIISGTAKADLNSTKLIEQPFETILSQFTKFFSNVTGNPWNFMLIPVVGVSIAIYVNADYEPITPAMFMLVSGVLLSSGYMFAGLPGFPIAFIVMIAIGMTGAIASIYLGHKK